MAKRKSFLDKAKEIVEELGEEYSVYEEYSGRGMYGATCLGIVGPDADEISFMTRKKSFGKGKFDSMGLKEIVYWPHIKES